jgi:phosphoribosylformylglycinamidine synthase
LAPSVGILVFPGSNCDHDAYHSIAHIMGANARFIWHKQRNLSGIDFLIIPGGFSYGDYLRSGAIARFSPIMEAISQFAKEGKPILGICNGFQVLLEAGLLPGTMMANENLRFVCKQAHLRCETTNSIFTRSMQNQQVLKLPVAHGEGNYFTDDEQLKKLRDKDQIIFRYCDPTGSVTDEANFNGSADHIAGICNEQRNILGLMPHPERAVEGAIGSVDGKIIFEAILNEFATF